MAGRWGCKVGWQGGGAARLDDKGVGLQGWMTRGWGMQGWMAGRWGCKAGWQGGGAARLDDKGVGLQGWMPIALNINYLLSPKLRTDACLEAKRSYER